MSLEKEGGVEEGRNEGGDIEETHIQHVYGIMSLIRITIHK